MNKSPVLNIHIKPTKRCNLRCRYCFEQKDFVNAPELSIDQMRLIFNKIRSYCKKTGRQKLILYYTGGEVLILGVNYWEEVLVMQRQILEGSGIFFQTNFQTNLTLLDDDYLKLFKDHRILVGTSLDPFSNARLFASSKRSITPTLLDKLILLNKNRVPFSVISMLTKENYLKAGRIMGLFNKTQLGFHTQVMTPSSYKFAPDLVLTGEEYGQAIILMLEKYIATPPDKRMLVETLESYVRNSKCNRLVYPVSICFFNGYCLGNRLFIENDGNIYPCDDLRSKQYYLGNIFRDSPSRAMKSFDKKSIFSKLKRRIKLIGFKCRDCEFVKMCNGGCPGFSQAEGDVLDRSTFFCAANKMIYSYLSKHKRLIARHF